MVQEYERAVIFRLGRLLSGGSRGPGKYLEYNSARWFFGGGKLLQLHLVFFSGWRNSKTFKAAQLRRRITSSPLMHSSHWHCDFRAFRYFLRTSVRRELHKGRPSHLGYWHSPAGGLFHVWPKVLQIYLQLTTTTMLNRDQLDQRKWKKRNSRPAKWIVLVLFNYYLILECSHTTPNRAATGVSDITRWLTPLTLTELTRRQWWQWWQ